MKEAREGVSKLGEVLNKPAEIRTQAQKTSEVFRCLRLAEIAHCSNLFRVRAYTVFVDEKTENECLALTEVTLL